MELINISSEDKEVDKLYTKREVEDIVSATLNRVLDRREKQKMKESHEQIEDIEEKH
jgi:hypothetical protein